MTKVEILRRRSIVFGVVSVLLLAYLVLRPSEQSAVQASALPRLLPSLHTDDARDIFLTRVAASSKESPAEGAGKDAVQDIHGPAPALPGSGEATLPPAKEGAEQVHLHRQSDTSWVVASAQDYPADTKKVTGFLEDLVATRQKRVVSPNANRASDYAGADGWIRVDVRDASGKSLALFDLGKSPAWPDSFVRIANGKRLEIVRATELTADKARLSLDGWVEARLWPTLTLADVSKIEVKQREEKTTIAFQEEQPEKPAEPPAGEKPAEGTKPPASSDKEKWTMLSPEKAEPETWRVENLVRAFTGMRLSDLAGKNPDAARLKAYGLDDPAYRVVVTGKATPAKDGKPGQAPTYVLEIGSAAPPKKEGGTSESFYVRKGEGDWVYLVNNYSIGEFRKAAKDFLPPPKEKPAASGTKPAAGEGEAPEAGTGSPDAAPGTGPEPGAPPAPPSSAPASPAPGAGESTPPKDVSAPAKDTATPPKGAEKPPEPGQAESPKPPEEPKRPEHGQRPDGGEHPDPGNGG